MSRLPDPGRSYAVLIGASAYQAAELPDLPAVRNNLSAMLEVLTDPQWGGFTHERCSVVDDSAVARSAFRLLRERAALAEDTFVVYFAGHGLTSPIKNDLYLALADTDPDELALSALSYDLIREVFVNCPAVNRILILDCCFSGRATRGFMKQDRATAIGQVEISGTYILAATPANSVALAPVGAEYTAFTAELLGLLRRGVPDGPELLNLNMLFGRLRQTMIAKGYPRPTQLGTDNADQLAIARNPAYREESKPAPPSDHSMAVARSRRLPRKAILAIAIIVAMIAAVASTWIALTGKTNLAASSSPTSLPATQNSTVPAVSTRSESPSPTETSSAACGGPKAADDTDRSQPVRVLNNSVVPGLADRAAGDIRRYGWNVVSVGNHHGSIQTSTVYFRPGTEEEVPARELAKELCIRAELRFEGIRDATPGIIVIVTSEYNPKSE